MDIKTKKNSKLLYQRGDKKTGGVIDLRNFSSEKTIKNAKISAIEKSKNTKIEKKIKEKKEDLYSPIFALENHKTFEDLFSNILEENKKEREEARIKITAKKEREKINFNFLFRKQNLKFALVSFLIPIVIFSFSFTQKQIEEKGKVLGVSTSAYNDFKSAANYISQANFNETEQSFNSASLNFSKAKNTIDELGLGMGKIIADLPVNTPLSTAKSLTAAGEDISEAGKNVTSLIEKISTKEEDEDIFEIALEIEPEIKQIALNLDSANRNIQKVEIDHLPEDIQEKISISKEVLPLLSSNFNKFAEDYSLIQEIFGSKKSQKYLLLFQNNSEIRATGGFIGSYGILEIENGKIKEFFIDNIFNPDGQLKEKVVPPMPIQKISSAWSMHDANWFADFPTSAQKVALFYEKTGGSTVDGVIAVTPEFTKAMLEVTGPIDMPEYDLVVDENNFIKTVQNQVENLYDKEENKPKKIISDLAPKIIEELSENEESQNKNAEKIIKMIEKTEEMLEQKHILIYHRKEEIQNMIEKRGWGGEIISTDGDYLSVVNSNINGYKTDSVIEENIDLKTEIFSDGSIVNTLTINRKHLGGDSEYDWYNRVNADYMRVYVPKGSVLLSAEGNTKEEYNPPIDYENFSVDSDVNKIESTIKIEPESQTQIFEESGKTVFGNWVYVSPKEEVTVTYKYKLPFKVNFDNFTSPTDTYKILLQKQLGSIGSNFTSQITFPEYWKIAWKNKDINEKDEFSSVLESDKKYGIVFEIE